MGSTGDFFQSFLLFKKDHKMTPERMELFWTIIARFAANWFAHISELSNYDMSKIASVAKTAAEKCVDGKSNIERPTISMAFYALDTMRKLIKEMNLQIADEDNIALKVVDKLTEWFESVINKNNIQVLDLLFDKENFSSKNEIPLVMDFIEFLNEVEKGTLKEKIAFLEFNEKETLLN